MRKLTTILAASCVMAFSANAYATQYQDTVTFAANTEFQGMGTFGWSHVVSSDFQIPFDTVNSATLLIKYKKAYDNNDYISVVNFAPALTLGNLGNATNSGDRQITFDLETLGVFSASWASGQPLSLSLSYNTAESGGNNKLTMVSSQFDLDYTNGFPPVDPPETPVPEPGTLMFLGAGFLGLALYGKRRQGR